MATVDSWLVEIFTREQDRKTHAEARMTNGAGGLTGQGTARRNPEDREAPQIGEEIAAARALSDLAHKLLDTAGTAADAFSWRRTRNSASLDRSRRNSTTSRPSTERTIT